MSENNSVTKDELDTAIKVLKYVSSGLEGKKVSLTAKLCFEMSARLLSMASAKLETTTQDENKCS